MPSPWVRDHQWMFRKEAHFILLTPCMSIPSQNPMSRSSIFLHLCRSLLTAERPPVRCLAPTTSNWRRDPLRWTDRESCKRGDCSVTSILDPKKREIRVKKRLHKREKKRFCARNPLKKRKILKIWKNEVFLLKKFKNAEISENVRQLDAGKGKKIKIRVFVKRREWGGNGKKMWPKLTIQMTPKSRKKRPKLSFIPRLFTDFFKQNLTSKSARKTALREFTFFAREKKSWVCLFARKRD